MFKFLCWLNRNNLLPRFIWSIGGDNAGWASFFIDLPFCQNIVIGGDMWCDVAVIDGSDGTVYLYRGAPLFYGDEFDDFLIHHGHRPSCCDVMVFYKVVRRKVKTSWFPVAENFKHESTRFAK